MVSRPSALIMEKQQQQQQQQQPCLVCHDSPPPESKRRILPAKRQFCRHCVKEHLSSVAGTFHCPTCGRECEALTKVSTKPATNPDNPDAVLCANADHGAATTFCNECVEFYCAECVTGHRLFGCTKRHKMRPVGEMTPAEIKQARSTCKSTCTEHEQPLSIYCKTCKSLNCTTCAMVKHPVDLNHHCQDLLETAREALKELEHMAGVTSEYITAQDGILTEMKKTEDNIHDDVKTAKAEVISAAREICGFINSRRNVLIGYIERHETETMAVVAAVRKEAEDNKTEAICLKDDVDSLYNSGRAVDTVMRTPGLQHEFHKRTEANQHSMTWKFVAKTQRQFLEPLHSILGSVSLKSPSLVTPGTIRLGKPVLAVPLMYDGNRVVTGMVALGDCICVTHSMEPHLWLYDTAHAVNTFSRVPGLRDAEGMALVKPAERTLVIADQGNDGCKLHFVKASPNLDITYPKVANVPLKNPRRVNVSAETGQLLVGQFDSVKFAICSKDGDLQKKIAVGNGAGSNIRCVTKAKAGTYAALVWDRDRNGTINWVDECGNCSHTYGCNGGEQLRRPHHMIQDSKGRLIVADHDNHRLHLVDISRHLAGYLLTEKDGIHGPECVYLDEEAAKLYVAHGGRGSREIRVYRWPIQSGDKQITYVQLDLELNKFS